MQRVSSASQLVDAISPYKRPRAQSPHGPHGGIFYSPPDHRFIAGGAHYSPGLYPAPQRDVRPHVQEITTINYPDRHPRDVGHFSSLQSQIRRRPSLLSEFHGGAAERERERSKEFFQRQIDPSYRLHPPNHHAENDVIAAKRRRMDNDTKFRPVHDNNSAAPRVVTSSANQPEVKKEPFIPKVENVSPTPCDDEPPSSMVSKEGLLQSMEKMDREIQMVESQITNLKKKKQELEQRAALPRDEEKAVADEDWEPKQEENPVQLIYAENQRKAESAHKDMAKCGGQSRLPLYNQVSDIKDHKEVLKKNYELSRRFILYFKRQASERSIREKNFCQQYHKRMEVWENRMEKLEADPKKKVKDAKTREFFEKQFPEIRKQREQQERFSRAGTRSWGNIARSDAELAEIVDGLNEREAQERHMRSLTVIPPILLEKEERNVNFINSNGLVEDALQEYKDRQRMNIWTDEERDIFREKYLQHPKNFGAIAAFLERKTVAECVLYYYQSKKRESYKQRKQQVRRKKPLPPKNTSTTVNRNHDDEDKDDKEDGTSQDPKKKDGGDNKDGLNGGSSQNGETTNGPPISVPTNCALCHHSLDAYTMSRPLSKSNCELLGLNINEVTASMRVCSKCRFRSLRKSPCPVTTCKKARRKAKRLKPLPTKWLEISADHRKVISEELGIASDVTKCCPACFHRITRRLSNENGPDPSITKDGEIDEDPVDTPGWTKKEICDLKQALRKHGKKWDEVSTVVATKTEVQCKELYSEYRRKLHLGRIVEEYEREKVRVHRVSVAESLGSTITAPSDDDMQVPSSDNDADESSDTASASENEEGPLRFKGPGGGGLKGVEDGATASGPTPLGGVCKDSSGKDPTGKETVERDPAGTNADGSGEGTRLTEGKAEESGGGKGKIGDDGSTKAAVKVTGGGVDKALAENDKGNDKRSGETPEVMAGVQEGSGSDLNDVSISKLVGDTKGPPVEEKKEDVRVVDDTLTISLERPPSGDASGLSGTGVVQMEVDLVRTEPKPGAEDDGGDTSATCSADEGNPMDVDVAFSDGAASANPPAGQLPPARDRVSSSEDDTKLSELKAKLEVARTDGGKSVTPELLPGANNAPPPPSDGAPKMGGDQSSEKSIGDEDKQRWGTKGFLNTRDLIDSLIHKHLGQESPAAVPTSTPNDQAQRPKTTEAARSTSTQPQESASVMKPGASSPVVAVSVTQTRPTKGHTPRKTPPPDRSDVKLVEAMPTSVASMKTSHITHTSVHDRDIYEVSSTHRPSPDHRSPSDHRSPGKRLTSPAGPGYMDPLQGRLLEAAAAHHGGSPAHIGGTNPSDPRGASPKGGPERDQLLHSPSGRHHNYSPRSATSSPYALIPDRHHLHPQSQGAPVGGPARSLPRSSKQASVPPPPPLINKLSPMTAAIKQEKLSPSGGLAHTPGSISQGTPVGYIRKPDMSAVRFDGPGSKASNERLMMLARARSPATSSPHHEYTGGSITQGTPLTRRDQSGRPHERLMDKDGPHSKDPHHPMAPRVKVEQPPHGPEKGGWGFPAGMMPPYDGINLIPAELLKNLNERELALKMATDPAAMMYMYTQRHLMQYGGEYGPGMVRGQYATEAYTSSKATLADDFVTAQRMQQRMPLPTTSAAPSNPRQSPRQEAATANAKRGSPAGHHPPHHMEAIPGIPFAPFGLPPQQGGYIMVAPQYMQGMTVATGHHQLPPHPFTSMAPTHPSPRSPHSQQQVRGGHPHPSLDPQKHSPTVRAPSPSDVRAWPPGAPGGGHFKAPARSGQGAAAAAILMGQPPHHFGLPVNAAGIPAGSIMQGTPVRWQQAPAPSITSGTPNPDLRDTRKSADRGPSPLPKSQASLVKRSEAQRIAEYDRARKEHPAAMQYENEDMRRPPHHSSMPQESQGHHHQQQQQQQAPPPKRPPSHPRDDRRPPTREGTPTHPSQSQHPHERKLKAERAEAESKAAKTTNAAALLETMFVKDMRPPNNNANSEHGKPGGTGFTAASLIDHIIHQSINRPSEEEAQAEAKSIANTVATTVPQSHPPPKGPQGGTHTPPVTSNSSQNKGRLASSLIDQLIVQQIKHEAPEPEDKTIAAAAQHPPTSRPSSRGSGAGQKPNPAGREVFSYGRGGHRANHVNSSAVSGIPQGQYRPEPILAPHSSRGFTIGDHINTVVSKGYPPQRTVGPRTETVDSTTTAHRGRGPESEGSRVAHNNVHSSKSGRTVSPAAVDKGRAPDSSTVMNYSKRHEDPQGRQIHYSVSSTVKDPREVVGLSQARAPSQESLRTMDVTGLPVGYHGRVPHGERDFGGRGQIPRSEGTLSRTVGGHKLSPGATPPSSHLPPPHNAIRPASQGNMAVNYSREAGIHESINRMIERQVQSEVIHHDDGRRVRGYEQVRHPPPMDAATYKRNMTIAQLQQQQQQQSNGPPSSKANSNKENSIIHSSHLGGGHNAVVPPGMIPVSSHPGMVHNYQYPVLAFMPNHHQPVPHHGPAAGHGPMAVHGPSPPLVAAAVPRASPAQLAAPRRETTPHVPLLSSEYECLSDDE